MYYAALRPEEAVELRPENFASLPDHGWGELILTNSEPRSGTWWTDNGSARQNRELKHRPRGETRPVPIHPELVALVSKHLKKYHQGRTAASSLALVAASSTTEPISTFSTRPVQSPPRPANPHHCWPGAPFCGTRRSLPG